MRLILQNSQRLGRSGLSFGKKDQKIACTKPMPFQDKASSLKINNSSCNTTCQLNVRLKSANSLPLIIVSSDSKVRTTFNFVHFRINNDSSIEKIIIMLDWGLSWGEVEIVLKH